VAYSLLPPPGPPPPPIPYTIKRLIVDDTGGVGGAAEDVEVLSARVAGGRARTPFDVKKCVSSCNLQLAECLLYQLSVASTASAVSEVSVLHRRCAGVFTSIVSVCSVHD